MTLRDALARLPLVAILRGLGAAEAPQVVEAIAGAGFVIVEVPLNSPDPLATIRSLVKRHGERLLIGAGTVLTPEEVDQVAAAGGKLVVSPNCDPAVIRRAKQREMISLPGVATISECFAALAAGADGVKLFPAEVMPPAMVRAWRAVLPTDALLIPVGGITPEKIADYRAAGADGFGVGSALYSPGAPVEEIAAAARRFAEAARR